MRQRTLAAWIPSGGLLAALATALFGVLIVAPGANAQTARETATPSTLAQLITDADPGTVIELEPGTYGTHQVHGKQDLTLRAQVPGTAVFTGDGYDEGTGLSIADSSNITVDGIWIVRTKWGIGVRSSDEVSLSGISIVEVGQRGLWVHDGSTNVTLFDSLIEFTGLREGTNAQGNDYSLLGEGVYLGSGTNPNDRTSAITIADSTIRNTSAEAIDMKVGASDVTITGNTIYGVSARTGAVAIHPGRLPGNARNTTVAGNVIYDVSAEGADLGGSGMLLSAGATAQANIIFDTANDGIEVRDVTGEQNQVQLLNNASFQTQRDDYRVPGGTEIPEPVLSGNGGIDMLPNFPDGWIEDGEPTEQMWALVDERQSDIGAQIPLQRAPASSTTVAPTTTTTTVATPPANNDDFPVYDTAWQMLVSGTADQADEYFSTLDEFGFTGTWAGIIHHSPATYLHDFAGGGQVGRLDNGEIVLSDDYIAHVRAILDAAERHGQKVGLVAAWQNTYLPGGDTGNDELSNRVEGTLTTGNAYAYGQQIAREFGDHPAVSMWVFGGDAGKNNTDANKEVWRIMAQALRDAGMSQPITYHTPTASFGHLNYVGEPWLDFIAPETGHSQGPDQTEEQLRIAKDAYGLPVWQGESRYFNISFNWVREGFRNPGRAEVVADAQAAKDAGVSGYVYGDAGRWAWCLFQDGNGDTSPCNADNISASFGQAERDVIAVFR